MEADVILESPDRRMIMDTKFYKDALARGRGVGTGKLLSGNLYQLLAYLRNREATRPAGPKHEGILLYPKVGEALRADIRLEGFRIQAWDCQPQSGLAPHSQRNAGDHWAIWSQLIVPIAGHASAAVGRVDANAVHPPRVVRHQSLQGVEIVPMNYQVAVKRWLTDSLLGVHDEWPKPHRQAVVVDETPCP